MNLPGVGPYGLKLIREGLEELACQLRNQVATCPEEREYEEELRALERKLRQVEALQGRIGKGTS